MKKTMIMMALSIACTESFAQEESSTDTISIVQTSYRDRTDTIYYNKKWKTITNKSFANYYRLAFYPADTDQPREFKTYYITGELEGEGEFIVLDPQDDAKSCFNGEIVKYYKNGSVAEKRNYNHGTADGEQTLFYENGHIKEHYRMNNGVKNDLHTAFTEDGRVCRITPYSYGKAEGFYVITDINGNYSKYDITTDAPLLEQPSPDEVKTEYKNGVAWPYYNKNGLIVGVSNAQQKELGGYRELGIFVVNKSMINVDLDPNQIEVFALKNGKRSYFKFVSADEYEKKIHKQKVKIAKREKHKKKVLVAREHENNVNANLGAQEFNVGTSSTTKVFQERMTNLKELTGENRMHYAERLPEDLGYLERTTVHPGEIVSGYLYTSDRKVADLLVKVKINGIDYQFEWKN